MMEIVPEGLNSGGSSLPHLIRGWRDRAGLTQEQLAARAGVSARTIRRLESDGGLRPRRSSVRLLAEALGLSGDERTLLRAVITRAEPAGPDVTAAHRPSDGPGPHQLPADIVRYAGRIDQLRELDELLLHDPPATAPITVAITGTAGVGKTALAVHWAHLVADRFPDGQLYVNLRGYDPGGTPVGPGVALRGFLEALELPAGQIPSDVDAQSALYRSALTGRRVLVVLDNARDAAQVRPLLPGAPGCLVVVTSRDQLTGLVVTEGARRLTLDLLSTVESYELLASRVGLERVCTAPDAVEEIIALCARLPLALSVAAAYARNRADVPLSAVAGELRDADSRLDAFDVGDALVNVRQVFSWSYRRLSADATRLFRLLGLHPGPEISVPAAASLAGWPVARTRQALIELHRAHLVIEHVARFSLHDLLRAYAAELVAGRDSGRERHAALRRLLDHYLCSSRAAAALLDPHRDLCDVDQPSAAIVPEHLGGHDRALGWLTSEHPVLVACVGVAAEAGFHSHAWHLAWSLPPFLDRRGYWLDWVATQRVGLNAAERMADVPRQARSQRSLGGAYTQLGRWDEAQDHLERALAMYREQHDLCGQAHTHLDIDWLYDRRDDPHTALGHAEQALEQFRAAGDRPGEARALNNVGWHHIQVRNYDVGLDYCRQAVVSNREVGNLWGEANAWDSLGYAYHRLDQHGEAIDCYRNAVRMSRDVGDRPSEAESLVHLGDAYRAIGDIASARGPWLEALAVLDAMRHPDADGVRARLGAG